MSEAPLVREVEYHDPFAVLRSLPLAPGLVLLDSAMKHPELGRWSYLAADPFARFTVSGHRPTWNGAALDGAPLAALRAKLRAFACPAAPAGPRFQPGATGFISYEAGRLFEKLPEPRPGPACPEIDLFFHDAAIAFDEVERRAFVVSTGFPEQDPRRRRARRHARADWLAAELAARSRAPAFPSIRIPAGAWSSNFDRPAFEAAVGRVRDYIAAGDIFQANLTQRFTAPLPPGFDPVAAYAQLRAANPAPFGAFLHDGARLVASTSPERFLEMRGGFVETRPIKGTARRALDPESDRREAERLLASDKDRAENVMIVDLLRNDLSRVAVPGTVEVPVLCGLESYANVHHLVSVVTARLRPGLDALDLIAASFPGGSITGAPKIRAMEIIHALEPDPRGVYCGSVLHLGFDGSLASNIAIRTLVAEGGRASVHAGGGVTLLSDPAAEYEETLVKAERLFQAFDPAARARVA